MLLDLPQEIKDILKDEKYTIDHIGMSDSMILCFEKMILKIEKENTSSNREHQMLLWLQNRLPVPKIILSMKRHGINYLLMEKLPGKMACDTYYMEQPELLTELLADGLKKLWQIDITDCPLSNGLDVKLKEAQQRVQMGLCDMENVEPDTYSESGFTNPLELYQWLQTYRPKVEDLVFCHGDYCLPNIFFKDHHLSGFIDLGNAGIADRYQDIALCYRSLKHNYDGRYGYQNKDFKPELLFDKLNIEPDWEKIRYYILLDELF